MVTPGGEISFIFRMIDESLILKDRVQLYTSMLGKFSSIEPLVKELREKGVGNYAVTEFVQGTNTRRWGIAWSWEGMRPGLEVARGVGSLQKGLLPFPGEYVVVVSTPIYSLYLSGRTKLIDDSQTRTTSKLENESTRH